MFHVRVRDGIGCRLSAMATRSSKPSVWGVGEKFWCVVVWRGSGAVVCVIGYELGDYCAWFILSLLGD